jgi:hypothetical protein
MANPSKAHLSVTDPGLAVVEHLYKQMQIDPEWSVRQERGFTWWGDQLAQRVWASSSQERAGDSVWQVHIESDLVRDVHSEDPFSALSELNRLASLSACVFEGACVRRHASVSVTENNLPFAKELAIHAMSLQAADAWPVAQWLRRRLHAVEDVSHHPVSGPRPSPDEMLGVALLYRRKREEGVWTPPIDFSAVANAANRCWVSATAGTHSFTAELPFGDIAAGPTHGAEPATALFQTWTDKPNPIYGTGALLVLKVPGDFDAKTANVLNSADTLAPDCHQLGAWCHRDDSGLAFVTFLPALVFQRGGHYATNLFESLVWHSASRALWAQTLLTP